MYWRKGNNRTFWRLLDTGSEMALILGESKHLCGPAVGIGITEGQVIYGTVGPQCGYSPTSRMHR